MEQPRNNELINQPTNLVNIQLTNTQSLSKATNKITNKLPSNLPFTKIAEHFGIQLPNVLTNNPAKYLAEMKIGIAWSKIYLNPHCHII